MHINAVKINDIWVSYDIVNVKAKTQKGQKIENIQSVATFTKEGEQITKIYNIGNFDYCAKLLNDDFAKSEARRMIENNNVSK